MMNATGTWTAKASLPVATLEGTVRVVNSDIYAVSGVGVSDTLTAVGEMHDPIAPA